MITSLTALRIIIAMALLVTAFGKSTAAEPRTALIIGNAAYADSPLRNPTNDATAIAQALRGAGFEVMLKTDANQRGMQDAIRGFGAALKNKGGVGLFYFSGHGVQVNGENYLIPVGEDIENETDLKRRAVMAAEAVDAMASAQGGLNIVVLDACRNNPIAGSGTLGLSRIDSSANLFVSFATSPGSVALDGEGRNSPYTKHLADAVAASNLTLEETFKRTLKGVYQETRGDQTPWISSSFFGDFVFRPTRPATPASAPASPPTGEPFRPPPPAPAGTWTPPRQTSPGQTAAAAAAASLAGVYHADGLNPNKSRYRGMAIIVPEDEQVRFTWWIGKDVFSGRGHFAGRMLVVYWGQKHPVIYDFGRSAKLDGEWADGKATERLSLFARAADSPAAPPEGRYKARGRNPNGSTYTGTVSISRRGDRYHMEWQIGSSTYRGTGTLDNNLLTVDWGSSTPVVYALSSDGVLRGLWEAGKGEETLTPD